MPHLQDVSLTADERQFLLFRDAMLFALSARPDLHRVGVVVRGDRGFRLIPVDGATRMLDVWAWLVENGGKLAVTKTGNADLPMKHGQKALLTIDVWEHAYYIDYRNARPKYVETFFKSLANWDFALANLKK